MTVAALQRLWSVAVPLAGALLAASLLPEPIEPWQLALGGLLLPVLVVAGLMALEFSVAAVIRRHSSESWNPGFKKQDSRFTQAVADIQHP